MQWLANNYQWLLAIVIIPALGFLLKRYVFTEPDGSSEAARTPAPDSHPSNSAVASGNVTNIYTVQPHVPAPATPVTLTPDIGALPRVKPRPNMKMTGAKVISINEYDPGRLVEDSTGRAEAIVILFTNESRAGHQNVGGDVKASLVYEDNDVEILRIIGAWMGENWDSATFNVDDVHKLVVGFRLRPAGVIALEMRRQQGGHYAVEPHSVPSFQTVLVRLTHASSGDFLYAGRFRVTLEPELAIVPIVDGQV